MSIQMSILFCICIALTIPLLVLSTSNQELEEINENLNNVLDRFPEPNRQSQQPFHSLIYDDEDNNEHFMIKKAANIEQILRPCNQIPASGGREEYANCVRSRMLLMGRRKRRQAS